MKPYLERMSSWIAEYASLRKKLDKYTIARRETLLEKDGLPINDPRIKTLRLKNKAMYAESMALEVRMTELAIEYHARVLPERKDIAHFEAKYGVKVERVMIPLKEGDLYRINTSPSNEGFAGTCRTEYVGMSHALIGNGIVGLVEAVTNSGIQRGIPVRLQANGE